MSDTLFNLTQTRIHELSEYIQQEAGETGYIDPSEIWVAVDHPSFDKSKKYRVVSSEITTESKRSGRLTSLSSRTISISWSFTSKPIGWHRVYREINRGTDKRYQDVLIKSEDVTSSALSIVIDDSETLTGIIVEYSYEPI